ncbi:pentapeptide repeat-containing protein [Streptomyces ovatisporus]|uniref:Pentapeptide repeat-containing protein n=1 Tax=Streptomyces ovatisporus TaxID=1128682 RepID=A0ABV9A825_9ACTN
MCPPGGRRTGWCAQLRGANMGGANLEEAFLVGAQLERADLPGTHRGRELGRC